MKEFHLWCNNRWILKHNIRMFHIFYDVKIAVEIDTEVIHTTQVCTVSTRLFEKGYRIFVHDKYGKVFEIKLVSCERTDKEIRQAHNLAKMLENGVFGDVL